MYKSVNGNLKFEKMTFFFKIFFRGMRAQFRRVRSLGGGDASVDPGRRRRQPLPDRPPLEAFTSQIWR